MRRDQLIRLSSKVVIFLLLLAVLMGCSSQGFELGEQTSPPLGCIEYLMRGGKC